MPNFTRWISGATVVHSTMGPAYYNTALTMDDASATQNAKLTIYLRVLMVPAPLQMHPLADVPDPSAPGGKRKARVEYVPVDERNTVFRAVKLKEWDMRPAGEFDQFRLGVKGQADGFWDNTQLCLIPPKDYRGLLWPANRPTHRLNVDCRFELVWANSYRDAHRVIYCKSIDEPHDVFTLRSNMGVNYGVLDSGDLMPNAVWSNQVGIGGTPAMVGVGYCVPHEFGHALGLPHVGIQSGERSCLNAMAGRPTDMGPTQCYLGPTVTDSLNVMGLGCLIAPWNGLPWLLRAPLHTTTHLADWRIVVGKRAPQPL
jgi:hypothetical protein